MQNLTTYKQALEILNRIKSDPLLNTLPTPSIKVVKSSFFDRSNQATDAFHIVWPNGVNVTVYESGLLLANLPSWFGMRMRDIYDAETAGLQELEPGTSPGIEWKDPSLFQITGK